MMAELSGRVTSLEHDSETGALRGVTIENSRGDVRIFKPDAWLDQESFEAAVGQRVDVRVVVTVAA